MEGTLRGEFHLNGACVDGLLLAHPLGRPVAGAAATGPGAGPRGFVTRRLLEASVVVIGVVSLMAVVSLRQPGATGADADPLVIAGRSLVAVRDRIFLLGPGLVPAIDAALLGTLLYRSHLVPRLIPTIGLIGAPLLLASDLATFFGVFGQTSGAAFVLALPIAVWEFSLGVWLVVKGFRPCPLTAGTVRS